MMIEWDDSMSIGVAEIDAQHRELVRRYNGFELALSQGCSGLQLMGLLQFLRGYAQEHFESEERYMKQTGYPEFTAHALRHLAFVGKQFWLYSAVRFDEPAASAEISAYLRQWILDHIMVEDRQIGEYATRLA
jgi:hemerythrin